MSSFVLNRFVDEIRVSAKYAHALIQFGLIGGSGRTFALQPVSLEGSVAFNVALGVSGLKLRAVY
jgi:hypothetical protein